MNSIPLSAFRVPDGKLALTLALAGYDPFSITVPVERLENVLHGAETLLGLSAKQRLDREAHIRVRQQIHSAMRNPPADAAEFTELRQALGILAFWLTLNHPTSSGQMRRAVAEELRKSGKAHVSVTVDEKRTWAFALAPEFVDVRGVTLAADFPDEPVSVSIFPNDGPKATQH
jgi:hypothetical protein